MITLSKEQVLMLHERLIEATGGSAVRYFWNDSGDLVSLCRYTGCISEKHPLSMNMK